MNFHIFLKNLLKILSLVFLLSILLLAYQTHLYFQSHALDLDRPIYSEKSIFHIWEYPQLQQNYKLYNNWSLVPISLNTTYQLNINQQKYWNESIGYKFKDIIADPPFVSCTERHGCNYFAINLREYISHDNYFRAEFYINNTIFDNLTTPVVWLS